MLPSMAGLMLKTLTGDVAVLNVKDQRGRTLLHLAASGGNALTCQMLIDKGLDVNATSGNFKETPLHLAATSESVETVLVLLKAGGDKNKSGSTGTLPIELAKSRAEQLRKERQSGRASKEDQIIEVLSAT